MSTAKDEKSTPADQRRRWWAWKARVRSVDHTQMNVWVQSSEWRTLFCLVAKKSWLGILSPCGSFRSSKPITECDMTSGIDVTWRDMLLVAYVTSVHHAVTYVSSMSVVHVVCQHQLASLRIVAKPPVHLQFMCGFSMSVTTVTRQTTCRATRNGKAQNRTTWCRYMFPLHFP